ncbi:MAG TPA: cytochrome c biogenesis protein CcsA [Bacteroidia bacterium]|nr:cytochrome c biogenesis protein CcsA [Bacteroidia bacterium]
MVIVSWKALANVFKRSYKFFCIVFLLIGFAGGILVPLAPGIISADSSSLSTFSGPFTVKVFGYNTHFRSAKSSLQGWITNEGKQPVNTCATSVNVIDDTHLELSFPPVAPLNDPLFGLTVYNDADGRLYMNSAIATTDTVRGGIVPACNPVVKNEKQDHFAFPFRYILYESMRNLFFHVPMWFTMIALLSWAVVNNLRFLRGFDMKYDRMANNAITTGIIFGLLGLITGSLWARVTWRAWWVDDVKLNGTAITMLSYLAYLVLRNSMEDEQKRARISAIYSIFAYVMMIVLIGVLPRLQGTDSLHPGNGGNPAFSSYDLDNSLRVFFYPAVAGWVLLGVWIYSVRYRMSNLKENLAAAEVKSRIA